RDVNPPGAQLDPERVGDSLERVFRCRVRAGEREGEEPGDRADENDAARVTAEEREERLRDGDLADHVDLELAAQLFGREELERAGDRDPGVVDEPRESGAALALRDAV